MKITVEPIEARDLMPGDLFSTKGADYWEAGDQGGVEIMMLRTDQRESGFEPNDPVYRLRIERKRWTHGLRSTYIAGCRCGPCTSAQRIYMRTYKGVQRARAAAAGE